MYKDFSVHQQAETHTAEIDIHVRQKTKSLTKTGVLGFPDCGVLRWSGRSFHRLGAAEQNT